MLTATSSSAKWLLTHSTTVAAHSSSDRKAVRVKRRRRTAEF
jgi:hypothetical protein